MASQLFKKLVSIILMVILLAISLVLLSRITGIRIPFFSDELKIYKSFQEITPAQNAVDETSRKLAESVKYLAYLNDPILSKEIEILPPRANVFSNDKIYKYEINDTSALFRVLDFCFEYYFYHSSVSKTSSRIYVAVLPKYCPVNLSVSKNFAEYMKNKKVFYNRLAPLVYSKDEEIDNYIKNIFKSISDYSRCDDTFLNFSKIFRGSSSSFFEYSYFCFVPPQIENIINKNNVKAYKLTSNSRGDNLSTILKKYIKANSFSINIKHGNNLYLKYENEMSSTLPVSVIELNDRWLFYSDGSNYYYLEKYDAFDFSSCFHDPDIYLSLFFATFQFNVSITSIDEKDLRDQLNTIIKGSYVRIRFPQDKFVEDSSSRSSALQNLRYEVNLYGDPEFLLYFSYFPKGYEKYWTTPSYVSFKSNTFNFGFSIFLDFLPVGIDKARELPIMRKIFNPLLAPFSKISKAIDELALSAVTGIRLLLAKIGASKIQQWDDVAVGLYHSYFKRMISSVSDSAESLSKGLKKIDSLIGNNYDEAIKLIDDLDLGDDMKKIMKSYLDSSYALKTKNYEVFLKEKMKTEMLIYSLNKGMNVDDVEKLADKVYELSKKGYGGERIFDEKTLRKILANNAEEIAAAFTENEMKILSSIASNNIRELMFFGKNDDLFYLVRENYKLKKAAEMTIGNLDFLERKMFLDFLDSASAYDNIGKFAEDMTNNLPLRKEQYYILNRLSGSLHLNYDFFKNQALEYYRELNSLLKEVKFQGEIGKIAKVNDEVVPLLKGFFGKVDDIKIKESISDFVVYKATLKKTSKKAVSMAKIKGYGLYSSINALSEEKKQILFLVSLKNELYLENLKDAVDALKKSDVDEIFNTLKQKGIYADENWRFLLDNIDENTEFKKIILDDRFRIKDVQSKEFSIVKSDIEDSLNLYRQLDVFKYRYANQLPDNLFTSTKNLLFDEDSRKALNFLFKTLERKTSQQIVNHFVRGMKAGRITAQMVLEERFDKSLNDYFNNYCDKEINLEQFKNKLNELINNENIDLSACRNEKNPATSSNLGCKRNFDKFEELISKNFVIDDSSLTYDIFMRIVEDYEDIVSNVSNFDKNWEEVYTTFITLSCQMYNKVDEDMKRDLRNYAFITAIFYGTKLHTFGMNNLRNIPDLFHYSVLLNLPMFSAYYNLYRSYVDYSNEKHERTGRNTFFLHSVNLADPATTNMFYKEYYVGYDNPISLHYNYDRYGYLAKDPFVQKGFAIVSPCDGILKISPSTNPVECNVFGGLVVDEYNYTFYPRNITGIPIHIFVYEYFMNKKLNKENPYKLTGKRENEFELLVKQFNYNLFNFNEIVNNINDKVIQGLLDDSTVSKILSLYFEPTEVIHNCSKLIDQPESYLNCIRNRPGMKSDRYLLSAVYYNLKDPYLTYKYVVDKYVKSKKVLSKVLFYEISKNEVDLIVLFSYLQLKAKEKSSSDSIFSNDYKEFAKFINYLINDKKIDKMNYNVSDYYISNLEVISFDYDLMNIKYRKENNKIFVNYTLVLDYPNEFYKYSPYLFLVGDKINYSRKWNASCKFTYFTPLSGAAVQDLLKSECEFISLSDNNIYNLEVNYKISSEIATITYDQKETEKIIDYSYFNSAFLRKLAIYQFYLIYDKLLPLHLSSTSDSSWFAKLKEFFTRKKNKMNLNFDKSKKKVTLEYTLNLTTINFTLEDFVESFDLVFSEVLDYSQINLFKITIDDNVVKRRKKLNSEPKQIYFNQILNYNENYNNLYYILLAIIDESGYVLVNSTARRRVAPVCYESSSMNKYYYNVTFPNQYVAEFLHFTGACYPSNIGKATNIIRGIERTRTIISWSWFGLNIVSMFFPPLQIVTGLAGDLIVDSITEAILPAYNDIVNNDYFWPAHKE
ncbi:MAG: hypothetical protein QXS41_03900 [Candidatus Woesearchaeota archaeon]